MTLPTTAVRHRAYDWADPATTARAAGETNGLEFLRRIASGELPAPPMARTLGFEIIEVSEGKAIFAVTPAEWHYNPIGVVHGGLAATLLDSALGCSVHSTLPAGVAYTTLELKVNLVRPVTGATGRLRCEARVVHSGRRVATAEGRVIDEAGKLYAHGTTTCLIIDNGNGSPAA